MNQKSPSILALFITACVFLASSLALRASPYASGITGTNAAGDVGFFMNEAGATVTVTFEDASTLPLQSISTFVIATGGSNYTTAPTVTITGGGRGAVATATLSTTGTVATVTIANGGTYYSVPTIGFTGGGGSNAAATATLGTLKKGTNSFPVGSHTTWAISCYKLGSGLPALISDDAFTNSIWTNGTGVAVNSNPKNGATFGRVYAGNSAATPGTVPKALGIYAMNADQTFVAYAGPTIPGAGNSWAGGAFSSNFKSPGRMRVAPNGKLLVADGQGLGNANRVYMFESDLSSAVALLGPSSASGAGDLFGTPVATGSLEAGNLVLYTASAGVGAPDDTNCVLGPLTSPGSFNCIFRYNIGAGPLPWNKRPDYAYTVGLDGIAQLRPEVDVAADGKVYAGFGRANLSNPNLQILAPFPTTNGITGDPANIAIINAGKSSAMWLYTGGVTPPFNNPPVTDPWNGSLGGSGGVLGTYGGVRASPDGRWFAAMDNNNALTVANLTNGIPDDGTIFGIANGTTAGNQAGLDWDAADNLWAMARAALPTSVGAQARLRCYSLGLTTTCVSSNDWTGTNGSFVLVAPPISASVAIINPVASQNYVNNQFSAGDPIPGVFRIRLNTANTTAVGGPTYVSFVRSGTAVGPSGSIVSVTVTNGGSGYTTNGFPVTFTGGGGSGAAGTAIVTAGAVTGVTMTSPGTGYTTAPSVTFTGSSGTGAGGTGVIGLGGTAANYIINTNETPNGVTITPNGVIFPAGVFAGSNGPNWNVDVKIIPTPIPLSGPTLVFNVRLNSGTNYSGQAPVAGSLAILNTGPQLLQLSAAAPATLAGMNRGIPNDYARFVITRLGDTNGPGNDAVNPIVQTAFTVTTVNYLPPASGASFMANYGVDYTAGAQIFTGSLPVNGSPGILIAPGAVAVNAMIGNPVKHTDPTLNRTNLSVIITLTNICNTVTTPGCNTNCLSAESYPYRVTTTSLTLNEFDNANGGEVVLWSNPLTNALDSTNWTLVGAHINQDYSPTLPIVISNYDNSLTGPGLFTAAFGKSVSDPGNDGGVTVPPSATMLAKGWTTALKVSVNKDAGQSAEAGINLYPQIPGAPWNGGSNQMQFQGNYALRFDMFLSLYDYGLNNPTIGTPAREFAAFGMNHFGTNANWRLDINPRADGTGSRPINSDGEWCSIGAASGSITPADYDMFISPAWIIPIYGAVPFNTGTNLYGTNDPTGITVSNTIVNLIVNTNQQRVPFNTTFIVGTNAFAPYTNAYQGPPGYFPGVTNVFNNGGVQNDQFSLNTAAFGGTVANGIIKSPPFSGINNLGGAPDNAWVDVSLELSRQTNLTLKVAQQVMMQSSTLLPVFGTSNPLAPYGGTPMLGYLDPNRNISDYSAFVYYSNVRLVELSPFIPWTNQPVAGLIVTQGATFTLSSGATFASNPLTNTWYVGTTNGPYVLGSRENGTPTAALITNVFAATSAITNLTVTSIQSGTNYLSKWSDQAGSITNYSTIVEVISAPISLTVNAGVTTNAFTVTATGNAPPTYQWKRSGTNLVAGTQAGRLSSFGGVTAATLSITNVQPADAGVYSNLVVNANGSVVVSATLTVNSGPGGATVTPTPQTNSWGSNTTFTVNVASGTPPFAYQWKKNGTDISGATTNPIVIPNITAADAGSYTAFVTNSVGNTLSSAGVLVERTPAPTIGAMAFGGGGVTLPFSSSNPFDTTSSFELWTSGVVTGPYTVSAAALISGSYPTFSVFVPVGVETNTFLRLRHKD